MYEATTEGLHVTVAPHFMAAESEPSESRFFWAYSITLTNNGRETVQLISRYWRILDGNGRLQEVRGEGVVGQQPVIRPGDSFSYTSGCPLSTPHGSMSGSYLIETASGNRFEATIPAFPLVSPHARPTLH